MKNKWYRSKWMKTILVIAENICAILIIISMLCVLAYPMLAEEMIEGRRPKAYEDSMVFEESLKNYSMQAINGIWLKDVFETKGQYNPDKVIDIEQYWDTNIVSGKNTSGLAYRLEDLLNWDVDSGGFETVNDTIIVCERGDGTYQYYTYAVFSSLISEGNMVLNGFLGSGTDILDYMNEMGAAGENFLQIKDEKGATLFVNCWEYEGTYFLNQKKPVDADSLLDIVNNDEHWNGRLQEASEMIQSVVYTFRENEYNYWEAVNSLKKGDTNYTFVYVDKGTGKVYSNQKEFDNFKRVDQYVEAVKNLGRYVVVEPLLQGFETNIPCAFANEWRNILQFSGIGEADFLFVAGIDTNYPVQDSFYAEKEVYEAMASKIQMMILCGIAALVPFIAGLVWLTIIAGKNSEDEKVSLNRFDRWKTEIAALITIAGGIATATAGVILFADNVMNISYSYMMLNLNEGYLLCVLAATALLAISFVFLLTGYLSLIRRLKAKTLWENSILKIVVSFLRHTLNHIHGIWKALIMFAIFLGVHWLAVVFFYAGNGWFFIFVMSAVDGLVGIYLILYAIGQEKIKRGIAKIAGGEVEYKISTEKMLPEHKRIAETINAIGAGFDAAVEKSMKSERLKTDLITNVSHDIKTPLTSIINYVDLLKKENFQDPKVVHYIEVLEQKAQRLKVLTEDVVEASKVSSGNIHLEYMRINFVEMIQQTSGEFEEKFKKRRLQEILSLPEEEVIIHVDGRRTWRILENIYNNAAKYALEGSRIYADLKVVKGKAVFMLKNISEQPLNITADELTERFIRGDISRSTEGSGLGLSIAKSLTEMQGGKFELYLDGDLFKVTIEFQKV